MCQLPKVNDGAPVRQIREYDVDNEEDAIERARKDGLVQGIMVEVIIAEAKPCNLGRIPLPEMN